MFTPPLKEEAADGRLRGFFFDVSYPVKTHELSSVSSYQMKTSGYRQQTRQSESPKEWWEAPVTVHPWGTESGFEFDIPEHMPSSPMCPANVKHKSKGKGICVVGAAAIVVLVE